MEAIEQADCRVSNQHLCPSSSHPLWRAAQRRLMEAIEQANVQENFDLAYEHNPEAFSSVCML